MPNAFLWNSHVPRAELDQRAREARLRLEWTERLILARLSTRGVRLKRVLFRFRLGGRRGRRVGAAPHGETETLSIVGRSVRMHSPADGTAAGDLYRRGEVSAGPKPAQCRWVRSHRQQQPGQLSYRTSTKCECARRARRKAGARPPAPRIGLRSARSRRQRITAVRQPVSLAARPDEHCPAVAQKALGRLGELG